jgi:hypothetical protein
MSQENDAGPQRVYLAGIYPVGDFEAWMDEVRRARRALARYGVTRHWVYRGSDDPKEIMSIMELPSQEHAERLLASTELNMPAWMDRIGLEIYPAFFVGEVVDAQVYPAPEPPPTPSTD